MRIAAGTRIGAVDHHRHRVALALLVDHLARHGAHFVESAGLDMRRALGGAVAQPASGGAVDAGHRHGTHELGHEGALPGLFQQLPQPARGDACVARQARSVLDDQSGGVDAIRRELRSYNFV